jgi:hypothetical protein
MKDAKIDQQQKIISSLRAKQYIQKFTGGLQSFELPKPMSMSQRQLRDSANFETGETIFENNDINFSIDANKDGQDEPKRSKQ